MKSTRIFFFLILALVVGFSSCKKEEISDVVKIQEEIKPEITTDNPLVYSVKRTASTTTSSANGGLDLGCFSIDFPFELVVDGAIVEINSDDDFNDAINSATQSLDFAYPLNITYPDGTTDDVADGEELGEAFVSCVPSGGWGNGTPAFLISDLNSCYELVFPVDLVDGAGNTYTANDDSEFVDLVVNNPELYFVFPMDLVNTNDGITATANDGDELINILLSCEDVSNPVDTTIVDGIFFCYDPVYPFDIINIDGDTETVENVDDFYNLLLNGTIVDFAYPLSLVDEDGNVITVNSVDELMEAFEDCFDFPVYEGLHAQCFIFGSSIFGSDCYELVYPFTVVAEDGTTTTINDATEAEDLANNPDAFLYTVELPVSIVLLDSGTIETINSEEDFYNLIASCDGGGGGPSQGVDLDAFIFIGESSIFGGDCYELVYPFDVTDMDGNSMAVNDAAAAEALITNPGSYYLVNLPVNITMIDSGDTEEVTSFEAFFELLVNCD